MDGPQVPREATHFDGDLLKVMDWNPNRFEAYIDGRRGTRENFARLMPWLEMSYDPIHHFTHIRVPERANRAVRNMAA